MLTTTNQIYSQLTLPPLSPEYYSIIDTARRDVLERESYFLVSYIQS